VRNPESGSTRLLTRSGGPAPSSHQFRCYPSTAARSRQDSRPRSPERPHPCPAHRRAGARWAWNRGPQLGADRRDGVGYLRAGERVPTPLDLRQCQLLVGAEQLVSSREHGACREGNVHDGTSTRSNRGSSGRDRSTSPATTRGRRRYVWPARSLQSGITRCPVDPGSRELSEQPWGISASGVPRPERRSVKARHRWHAEQGDADESWGTASQWAVIIGRPARVQ
jgi:hypothetical protein